MNDFETGFLFSSDNFENPVPVCRAKSILNLISSLKLES